MSSEDFKAIATLAQFVFSIVFFVYAYKHFILPRKRKQKGKYITFSYRLPKKYFRLPVKGVFLEGSFKKLPLQKTTSSIAIVSKNEGVLLKQRKNEILTPKDDSYRIKFLDEGYISVNGNEFYWIKTHHFGDSKDIKMISYLLVDDNNYIELGCGSNTDEFELYTKDYDDLLNSIHIC